MKVVLSPCKGVVVVRFRREAPNYFFLFLCIIYNKESPTVAQWIEHLPSKQRVAGSIPAGRAIRKRDMQKFYVDDCPEELPVGTWIKMQLPWGEAIADVNSSFKLRKCKSFVMDFLGDIKAMQQSLKDAINKYGTYGWLTAEGESKTYRGFSITYNPNLQYKDQPIHQHTLGTKLNSGLAGDFYTGSSRNHEFLKNSYLDGMSFTEITPAAQTGALGEFLNEINQNLTITRSRMGIVSGSNIHVGEVNYHVDSELYELVRLNVPLTGDDSYVFQFEGDEPYILDIGRAYTWQTALPHRVYAIQMSNVDRANMVIGISPWLKYNREERYWYTNEFFGKKHPIEIIIEGHATNKVKFLGAQ